ncbi:MAG: hypothetical protein WBM39_10885 [Parasphingorhabdus sp.]
MIYRHSAFTLLALLMADGVLAQAPPASDRIDNMQQAETALTGYWQQDDGRIFYFTQEGSSLTSRHSKHSSSNNEGEVDFTATIYGNLIYGAHRAPNSRSVQEKCSRQIWVGMGLTLNEEGTGLKGFRGDRIVDPKDCSVKDSDPVGLVYIRIDEPEP